MALRPVGLITELLKQGESRVRGIVVSVLVGWSLFLLLAAGALSLVAYLLEAPWWAYLIVASLVVALLAPVVFAALVALAGIRTWIGRAEDASRLEAAVLVDDAAPPHPGGSPPNAGWSADRGDRR